VSVPTRLQPGDQAPPFELKDQHGNVHKLSDYRGKSVVLYFYPKDETTGCTMEACQFRDEHSALQAMGAVVLGVSRDDEDSHKAFAEHYELPFPLLVDQDHSVAETYGAWGEMERNGEKTIGLTRSTFLIGPFGRLREVWPVVRADGHAAVVKRTLEALEAQDQFAHAE
jgi:peroxiredoxin Q/BCP